MYQYAKRDVHNFSEPKYRTDFIQYLHPSGAMAAPLRNVSVNHNLILRRARIAGITSPQQPEAVVPSLVPESSNGRSKSPRESSNGATRVPSEGDSNYGSPFTPLVGSGYPPGIYTAVAHNGPLRRRIEDHWDELEEFQGHLQRAQQLLLGWLYTLYQLMLLVGWYVLGSITLSFVEVFKGGFSVVGLGICCIRWIRQAMSFSHMAVAWLLPTLDTIPNSALGATDNLKFRSMSDMYSGPGSITKGKRISLGIPTNAQVGNISSSSDLLLPSRLTTLQQSPHRDILP